MKSKKELIKELREITSAGMADCLQALEESFFDLEKAIDIVKTKGLNVVSGREGRVAADGLVTVVDNGNDSIKAMVEVNCQTDFVARGKDFVNFSTYVADTLLDKVTNNLPFGVEDVEDRRKAIVASSKENVVVRRWWVEQAASPNARVFAYVHSNNRIGVILTLLAPSEQAANDSTFRELGVDLAMQIAAMNPAAVSVDRLNSNETARQKVIFETQLTELKKPQAAWAKILDGKFNKWYTEVCLLNQESVVIPKTTVQQVIKNIGTKLGGDIQVINFIRCQVGDCILQNKENLADEVAKMM